MRTTASEVVLIALCLAAGCRREEPAASTPPPPTAVILRAGGYEVTRAELEEHLPFLAAEAPDRAPAQLRRYLLTDVVLPRKIARRLVPEERFAEARRKAEALLAAVQARGGTIAALEAEGARFGGRAEDRFVSPTRGFTPDVAEVFFSLPAGGVSPPIETAWGFLVLGVLEERRRDGIHERRPYSVFFAAGERPSLRAEAHDILQALLRGKPWIHPYYRDDLAPLFPAL